MQNSVSREQGKWRAHQEHATVKVTAVEENVSPVFFLQTDSLVSSAVEGRGDLEIICSCNIKSLSMYKINEKHPTFLPSKAETAQEQYYA